MNPVLVYGVMDIDYTVTLDEDWLQQNFPDMDVYTNEIVDEMQSISIYGYELQLNEKTGEVSKVSDAQKEQVQKLYEILQKYHAESKGEPEIGYFTALAGECDSDQNEYNPDCKKDDEDDEGDEDEDDDE